MNTDNKNSKKRIIFLLLFVLLGIFSYVIGKNFLITEEPRIAEMPTDETIIKDNETKNENYNEVIVEDSINNDNIAEVSRGYQSHNNFKDLNDKNSTVIKNYDENSTIFKENENLGNNKYSSNNDDPYKWDRYYKLPSIISKVIEDDYFSDKKIVDDLDIEKKDNNNSDTSNQQNNNNNNSNNSNNNSSSNNGNEDSNNTGNQSNQKANKEELRKLINDSNELKNTSRYTNETNQSEKEEFDNALSEAEKVLGKENATQKEVDDTKKALDTAKSKLDGADTNKDDLEALVNGSKELKNTAKYANETNQSEKEEFDNALSEAEKVLSKENATQKEVDDAKKVLDSAKSKIDGTDTNKGDLEALANSSKELKNTAKYTNETNQQEKEEFDNALAEAEKVLGKENATQKEVDNVKKALDSAKAKLDGADTNKEELKVLVNSSKELKNTAKYTNETNQQEKEEFDNALAEAEKVLGKENATQKEVDDAKKVLDTAKEKLDGEVKAVDKTELKKIIDEANEIKATIKYKNEKDESEKNKFDTDLSNAVDLFNNNDATQDEINEVIESLKESLSRLDGEVEKIDKSIEFRSITKAELFKVNDTGELTRVTGVSGNIDSATDYIAKLVNNGKIIVMPVSEIKENGGRFDVIIEYPKLVQYSNKSNDFNDNYSFSIEKTVSGSNVYTDFNQLINAIKSNPNGQFIIGSDLYATDTNDQYYINNFNGTIKSADGKRASIYNLKKPFINTSSGATIENINFKNIDIEGNTNLAAIVIDATDTNFRGLYLQGNLNFTYKGYESRSVGGMVSILKGNSSAERNLIKMNVTANDAASGQTVSLFIGKAVYANVSKNKIEGSIQLNNVGAFERSYVGAVMGNSYQSSFDNTIVDASVSHGKKTVGFPRFADNGILIVEESGAPNTISKNNADAKVLDWGLTYDVQNDTEDIVYESIDYSKIEGYESERDIAYYNIGKLLPLYDRETIVKYGNLVNSSSNLFIKKIYEIVSLSGNEFTTNYYSKNDIDKILIKYVDDSIEVFEAGIIGNYENTNIVEYSIGNELIYTPYQIISSNDTFINDIKSEFENINLSDESIRNILGIDKYIEKINQNGGLRKEAKIEDLYLNDSFNNVKDNIEDNIRSLIGNFEVVDLSNSTIRKYLKSVILEDKEEVLLGLSYINRLYDVDFGKYNIKNLVAFKPDFYDESIINYKELSDIGSIGFENLYLHNNVKTYDKVFSNFNKGDLINFLNYNKNIFAPTLSNNEWIKSSTKAFVHETESENIMVDTSIYGALTATDKFKPYILPLLNLKEDNVYVVTAPYVTIFGGYGRIVDNALKSNESEYDRMREEAQNTIRSNSKHIVKYMDFYLRLASDEGKEYLKEHPTEVFEGYYIKDSINGTDDPILGKRRWATAQDEEYTAIKDFFGPVGRYYKQSPQEPSAYTRRDLNRMYFDSVDIFGEYGLETLSHELVHNYDESVILDGYKYREGQSTESYALGLLESITSENSYYFGFNFMKDLSDRKSAYNKNIDRFRTKDDLKSYMHNLLDVVYLIDAVEADIISKMPKEDQKYLFNKIELVKEDEKIKDGIPYQHGNDVVKRISDEEWSNININSIEDMISNNLIMKTTNLLPNMQSEKVYDRDDMTNYVYIPMYYPIYAGYQNDTGTTGGIMFRLVSFELLAEFGWDNGFLSYASNKFKDDAEQSGVALSDKFIFEKIFNGRFETYKDFKMAMYKERFDKKDNIKQVSISSGAISNYDELRNVLEQAINKDLQKLKAGNDGFARQELKAEILKEYSFITNGFDDTIFN